MEPAAGALVRHGPRRRRRHGLAVSDRGGRSAFATWEAVPTASIAFQFAGFTSAVPFDDDGISVFGFDAQPDLDRVLGATTFVVDMLTGEIVESDVFFNSIFTWSTAAAGEPAVSICSRWRCTRSDTSSGSVIRRLARPRFGPKADAACSRLAP